jgi:hypothetical protein
VTAPPGRARARWLVALLARAGAIGGARVAMRACDDGAPAGLAIDAPGSVADALVPIPGLDAAGPDAAADAPPPPPTPIDAADRRRRDASSAPPVDAAPASAPPVDAPPPRAIDAAPAGRGFLTFTPRPYALVSVDGVDLGASPLYRVEFAAGRREVVFTQPVDRTVVLRKVVDLQPGQTITVR